MAPKTTSRKKKTTQPPKGKVRSVMDVITSILHRSPVEVILPQNSSQRIRHAWVEVESLNKEGKMPFNKDEDDSIRKEKDKFPNDFRRVANLLEQMFKCRRLWDDESEGDANFWREVEKRCVWAREIKMHDARLLVNVLVLVHQRTVADIDYYLFDTDLSDSVAAVDLIEHLENWMDFIGAEEVDVTYMTSPRKLKKEAEVKRTEGDKESTTDSGEQGDESEKYHLPSDAAHFDASSDYFTASEGDGRRAWQTFAKIESANILEEMIWSRPNSPEPGFVIANDRLSIKTG